MKITDYSNRALNVLATTIAEIECRVVVTKQIRTPISIAIGPRTIALDPSLVALDALMVAAAIIATFRKTVRESDDRLQVIRTSKKEWTDRAVMKLHEMFPKSRYLFQNRYKIAITWDQIYFSEKVQSNTLNGSTFESVSGVRFIGNNAIKSFLAKLALGTYPLETWDGLDLPVARLPFELGAEMPKYGELETLEEAIKDAKSRTAGIMNCFVRKCLGKLQSDVRFSHSKTGSNLDLNRIVRAVIECSAGNHPSNLYKVRQDQRDRIFHPDEHHVLQAIDLGSIQNHRNPYGYHPDLVAIVAEGFRHLGVGHSILLFADQVIEQNGQRYYIHMPIRLKAFEEPLQYAMVRLAMLISHRLGRMVSLGRNAPFVSWQPLQLDTAFRELQRVDKHTAADYQTILYVNTRSMQQVDLEYSQPDVLLRTAECIEDKLKEIAKHATESKTIDLDFVFLDPNVSQSARKGTHVAGAISLL